MMQHSIYDTCKTCSVCSRGSGTLEIAAANLPLSCPHPDAPLWARHPKIYLEVLSSGNAICPYCNTHYVFHGTPPKAH